MPVTPSFKARPTRKSNTINALWHHQHAESDDIIPEETSALDSDSRAEPSSPTRIIRNTLNLFRPSPPRELRTRPSLGNLSTRSNSANTSPRHERGKSLELEQKGGAIAKELGRTGSFKAKMAFALGNAQQAQARQGAELQEVTTEKLGFVGIDGDKKLRLLPSAWSTDSLPPPTATLFDVSSKIGLIAAASPDTLVIASTDAVRLAYQTKGDSQVKPFTPQLTIPIPRVSQVAFSADGKYLVICAEQGGGLAVYNTQEFQNNKQEPAFQIATNGVAVRTLAPNPNPELAHGIALVLTDGKLMVADLNSRQFQQGGQGSPVLREDVSCVAWSTKGKQLVAGLGDGSAVQMDIQSVKATIPRPPAVQGDQFIERIMWMANDEFITVHTPVDKDTMEQSIFTFISREKGTQNYTYQTLANADTFASMEVKRTPQHHYISRLRRFPPNIADLLIVASSNSIDINVLGKSTAPLSSETPAVNTFNTIAFAEDSMRAAMPQSDMTETSCIGAAVDISSKDKVLQPIKGDEMAESPHPLPAYLALNHEGVLSGWWMVYTDSLRQNQPYSELTALQGTTAAPSTSPAAASPFASSSAGQLSSTGAFAPNPQQPAFGAPAFAMPAGGSAFGGSSALGAKSSPWSTSAASNTPAVPAAAPAFGKPGFGTATFGAPSAPSGAFASAGKSLWGTPTTTSETPAKPAALFGGSGTTSTASPFSAFASAGKDTKASPFAATTSGASPFGTLGGSSNSTSFGMKTEPSFGSTVTIDSSAGGSTLGTKASLFERSSNEGFGTPAKTTTSFFGQQTPATSAPPQEPSMADDAMDDEQPGETQAAKPANGFSGFKLTSAFKPGDQDGQDDMDDEKPGKVKPVGASLFSDTFSSALSDTQKPQQPVTPLKESKPVVESTTPATPAAPPPAPKPAAASLPAVPESPQKTPEVPLASSSPEEVAAPDSPLSEPPASDDGAGDAPLPPDPGTVRRPAWFNEKPPGAADTHAKTSTPAKSSAKSDAPLPPDPSTVKKPSWFNEKPPGAADTPAKPFSSLFGGPSATPSKPLFGETPAKPGLFDTPPTAAKPPTTLAAPQPQAPIFSTTPVGLPKGMVLPPPASKAPRSPRSPSPIRSASSPARRGTPRLNSGSLAQQPPIQFAPSPAAQGISVPPPTKQQPSKLSSATIVAPPPEPTPPEEEELTAADLDDAKADYIRSILTAPLKPTRTLSAFEAHQDYTGGSDKSQSIARQMEQICRDVNDMIDTVGLNARTLESWLMWNVEMGKENQGEQRERQDLRAYRDALGKNKEEDEQWALEEVQDLGFLLEEMGSELNDGKVEDARGKLAQLSQDMQALASLRKKLMTIRKFVNAKSDQANIRRERDEQLSPEFKHLQQETRLKLAKFKKQLAEAEDALLILKSRLSSRNKKAPTVEAVTSTILKVTDVVKDRGADVDVLEMQMRKLGILNESSPSMGSSFRSSVRAGTPGKSSPVRQRQMGSREGTPSTPMGRSVLSQFSRMSVRDSPSRPGAVDGALAVVRETSQDEQIQRFLIGRKKRVAIKEALLQRLENQAAASS